jgi:branched-chain amino acid transport system permease protein
VTELAQLLVKGAALGSVYALVALGFVVVFKATGVINFAQGSLMLVGSYLTFTASAGGGVPFALAVALAAAGAVAVGLVVERLVVRRLVGQPVVSVVLATVGIAIVLDQLVTVVWGFQPHHLADPWGARSLRVAGVVLSQVDVATVAVVAALAAALSAFFRRTRMGLALRAAASDLEAAAAQGISPAVVSRLSWALAAGVAAVAGALLASGPAAATPSLGEQALRAFPAVLLGGFESLGGAVAGGVVIGVVEVLTAGYLPGQELVAPYVVMLAVLLVRPSGLLRAPEASRL